MKQRNSQLRLGSSCLAVCWVLANPAPRVFCSFSDAVQLRYEEVWSHLHVPVPAHVVRGEGHLVPWAFPGSELVDRRYDLPVLEARHDVVVVRSEQPADEPHD